MKSFAAALIRVAYCGLLSACVIAHAGRDTTSVVALVAGITSGFVVALIVAN